MVLHVSLLSTLYTISLRSCGALLDVIARVVVLFQTIGVYDRDISPPLIMCVCFLRFFIFFIWLSLSYCFAKVAPPNSK